MLSGPVSRTGAGAGGLFGQASATARNTVRPALPRYWPDGLLPKRDRFAACSAAGHITGERP